MMRHLHAFWMRLRAQFRRGRLERDLRDEVEFHLAMAAEEGCENPLRQFGNVARICEDTRAPWQFHWLESLAADLRFGLRSLARNPAFTITAVVVLALGIGGNAAIFSALRALLFAELPGVQAPGRLVAIGRTSGGSGFDTLSLADTEQIAREARSLVSAAPWRAEPATLQVEGVASRAVTLHAVGARYFDVLQPSMQSGRGVAAAGEVVISDPLWRGLFGADPAVVGRKILLDRRPLVVAGVAGRDFRGASRSGHPDVWTLLDEAAGVESNRAQHSVWLIARLRPGVSAAHARRELDGIAARIAREWPAEARDFGLALNPRPASDPDSGQELRTYFRLLGGVTLLVLLAACTNVANLLLARGAARQYELATRMAVGASRARLVRQLVTESVLLAVAAAICGIGLAYVAAAWMGGRTDLPAWLSAYDFRPDARVLLFSAALGMTTGLGFGVGPALAATGGATGLRVGRTRLREWLIAGQIGLSLTLVIGAALLLRSLANAQGIRLGFETAGVWLAECSMPAPDGDAYARAASQLRAEFGEKSISAVAVLPLSGRAMDGPVQLEGRTIPARFNHVGEGHFATIRVPLVEGREFTVRDRAGSLPVVIINQAFARAYGARVGQVLRAFPDQESRQIVGIVGDHVYAQLREVVRPTIYRPLAQSPSAQFQWEIRGPSTAAFELRLAKAVRTAVGNGAVGKVQPLEELFRGEIWQSRMTAWFVAAFAALALLLAAVGLYGIVAYAVAQRRREIGVRVALGARPIEIAALFLRRVATLALCGAIAGNALALAGGDLLRSQLYGVRAGDWRTLFISDAVLMVVAALAVLLPVIRAMRVHAAEVLRAS